MSDKDDDDAAEEQRRQQEINMFAAMALGNDNSSDDDLNATNASGGGAHSNVVIMPPIAEHDVTDDGGKSLFTAAANAGQDWDSGTFNFSSGSNARQLRNKQGQTDTSVMDDDEDVMMASSSSNLDKAAAVLDMHHDDEIDAAIVGGNHREATSTTAATMPPPPPPLLVPPLPLPPPINPQHVASSSAAGSTTTNGPQHQQRRLDTPMFAEQVLLHRPLWFGAVLPPRVLIEARAMVQDALREAGHNVHGDADDRRKSLPRLQQLRPAVRNVVGCLRTYGFGLDKLLLLSDEEFAAVQLQLTPGAEWWRGDDTVTVSCPVWDEDLRRERVEHHVQHAKPPVVSRVSTAPARLVKDSSNASHTNSRRQDLAEQFGSLDEGDSETNYSGLASSSTPSGSHASTKSAEDFSMIHHDYADAAVAMTNDVETRTGPSISSLLEATTTSSTPLSPAMVSAKKTLDPQQSEKELFAQWAQGSQYFGNSNNTASDDGVTSSTSGGMSASSAAGFAGNAFQSGTFQRVPVASMSKKQQQRDRYKREDAVTTSGSDDDDSVIDDELKKQVGLNDHLSKAIASLDDDVRDFQISNDHNDQMLPEEVMTQQMMLGRPLSNFEITQGCEPLFGVDDPPLPVKTDLGRHDTKEDVARAAEQKRSQEIIENYTRPNVFGPLACPNPAAHPDDCHSWNSRSSAHHAAFMQRMPSTGTVVTTNSPDVMSVPSQPVKRAVSSQSAATAPANPMAAAPVSAGVGSGNHNQHDSLSTITATQQQIPRASRLSTGATSGGGGNARESAMKKRPHSNFRTRYGWWNATLGNAGDMESSDADSRLQLPPTHHSALNLHVTPLLDPLPETLRQRNLPLSRMHSASSMTQTLPYVSDRPPSYRYLQIDTQAVGFPGVGEVEPLFCSMAIYNVDSVQGNFQDAGAAPVPDLRWCGRVTEALHFDVVTDDTVTRTCAGALWPNGIGSDAKPGSERSESTRCGVFPLPSNLNVNTLYAVLIVRKVLSDDADLDPYLKLGKSGVDDAKMRAHASRASARHGSVLLPFAFGVAPLLQVFGTEDPISASSRAVQIPLLRFSPSLGERQIIDHIMVMLFPRADHGANGVVGPAPVTNGGTAMLVMRNFGYLGLHAVVDSSSRLARDRLVDFTGELQLRVKTDDESVSTKKQDAASIKNYTVTVSEWHPLYFSEPSINGGREHDIGDKKQCADSVNPTSYAQELAPVPLQLTPARGFAGGVQSGPGRGRLAGHDIEPFYHTSFCNELLCHPRLLHSCPKGNIVIKVELREIEWSAALKAYLAHSPYCGPSVHNNRRGPYLVPDCFTSCSPRGSEPHFLDEFKIKLPLDLSPRLVFRSERTLAILFTVYNVKLRSKNKWKRGAKKLLSGSTSGHSADSPVGIEQKSRIHQLACGFLPITNQACVVDNGMHDVRIAYSASLPSLEVCEQELLEPTTLILVDRTDLFEPMTDSRIDLYADDTASLESGTSERKDAPRARTESYGVGSISDISAGADDASRNEGKRVVLVEPMSLNVRLVLHSSLHAQNETLCDFVSFEPDFPSFAPLPNSIFMSSICMGTEFLLKSMRDDYMKRENDVDDRLLEITVNITKYQLCALARTTSHMLRVASILWRLIICGAGDPSLEWSNPGAFTALRVHAFASLLHILGAGTLFMSKHCVTQIDGISKWNVVSLGRVIALVFDEGVLFGEHSHEVFDNAHWKRVDAESDKRLLDQAMAPETARKTPQKKKKRHKRSSFDISQQFTQRENEDVDLLSSFTENRPTRGYSDPILKSGLESQSDDDDISDAKVARNEVTSAPPKVDSKFDFQTHLRAMNCAGDDDILQREKPTGIAAANAMIKAYSGLTTGNQKWMTAPTRNLSTIQESEDDDVPGVDGEDVFQSGRLSSSTFDASSNAVEKELVPLKPVSSVKQMRVPNIRKRFGTADSFLSSGSGNITKATSTERQGPLIATSKQDMDSVDRGFLDAIGASLGETVVTDTGGEERSVGMSHHRKIRGHFTSIDWTLLGDGRDVASSGTADEGEDERENLVSDRDESMKSLWPEIRCTVNVPSFIERLSMMGNAGKAECRWFPYAYEVVIMQWAGILAKQKETGERGAAARTASGGPLSDSDPLFQAAVRSIGVAIASAPMLFEVIKKSLAFRIATLFRLSLSKLTRRVCPPVVELDETLLSSLELVIISVTDACLDIRNFDSWDLRTMSIDVNDSIARFLRDMYSFIAPGIVHRLILVYMSRFVTRDGKLWEERDSSIGLRCGWEVTKLRLNSISVFLRFPDFVRVNSPQMFNWTEAWFGAAARAPDSFYDETLLHFRQLRLRAFVTTQTSSPKLDVPPMRPHWLSEIVVDICMTGIEHAEPAIQQRSSSLLHEMFWGASRDAVMRGELTAIAGMYSSFLEKAIGQISYLSNFAPKSQIRRDIVPCLIFIMQSSPPGLLRSLWRHLFKGLAGCGGEERFGGVNAQSIEADGLATFGAAETFPKRGASGAGQDSTILDLFGLLNICLRTIEYDGAEENVDDDANGENRDNQELWRKEFLLTKSQRNSPVPNLRGDKAGQNRIEGDSLADFTTTISRKWQAHDGGHVLVRTTNQVVWELYTLLKESPDGDSLLNPAIRGYATLKRSAKTAHPLMGRSTGASCSRADIVIFVRGVTSLYLHALALRQSDLVIVATLRYTAEVIKIFGIRLFLDAVAETLQHWMRIIFLHCGARRAQVRIESVDLLELILRSTWEGYGSFFRIRVPLLAVQTEVMERIVATAAGRYYRDQRKQGTTFEPFSNMSAEASLVPLYRTLDRIETQAASQNVAFRGALVRMAGKLKKLYRAYIAARVLSFIQGSRNNALESIDEDQPPRDLQAEAVVRANDLKVMRVVNESEAHSKQFLGVQGTTHQRSTSVAHYEAVEDALIDAADVFSPTELPMHRVAWLRMLAEFHRSRKKYAEEATCHFHIHVTLQQASRLHGSLWSNSPFLPWTDDMPDPVYIDGDGPADPDFGSDFDFDADGHYGKQMDSANSFRRIFYRVANSVGMVNDDWDTTASKTLFHGITLPDEYSGQNPWVSLREMEENMVEEAELAAEIFLKAGIIESSRLALQIATQFYSQKFNYAKLAMAYQNLARTVVSTVPPIDATLPQEVSATLGRFYRVWFHGGAPDSLSGVEFIYRTEGFVRLDEFGDDLREVIKSIIPSNAPIHLVLDGRAEERIEEGVANYGFSRIGSAQLDPVRIKVTPLRPLFGHDSNARGLPEWFHKYVDEAFAERSHRSKSDLGNITAAPRRSNSTPTDFEVDDRHHREHARSYSASVFSSTGSTGGVGRNVRRSPFMVDADRSIHFSVPTHQELSGVDKFCFVQPKDRSRGTKDWWKTSSGDYAEKSLKVTQLQVANSFPACVARQAVLHRLVYSQSPLEAGVDAVCQWCAVLFRTAVATVGRAVLRARSDPSATCFQSDPGIGQDATRVVADCIHSSHVKEIGLSLLKKSADFMEGETGSDANLLSPERLSEEEIKTLQLKLARVTVVFLELLHLLIARNRSMLLNVIHERKKGSDATSVAAGMSRGGASRAVSAGPGVTTTEADRRPNTRSTSMGTETDKKGSRTSRSHAQGNSFDASSVPQRSNTALGHQKMDSSGTYSHQQSYPDGFRTEDAKSAARHHPQTQSDDQASLASAASGAGGVKTESAIALQGELQRAFINLVKVLQPMLYKIMQADTPRWLKQCSQDTYFSMGTYKQAVIPISDEMCFNASESLQVDQGLQLGGTETPANYDRSTTGSPRGSNAGSAHSQSVVSRGSDRFGYGQF